MGMGGVGQDVALQRGYQDRWTSIPVAMLRRSRGGGAASASADPVHSSSPSLFPTPYWYPQLRWVFVITPTHRRFTQRLDLVRLGNTLGHVDNVYWVLVEDSARRSHKVDRWLNASMVQHWAHLWRPTRGRWQVRGAQQRNHGIAQLRQMINEETDQALRKAYQDGVVYFADDDNAYDVALFDQIRQVRSLGAWPVGLCGGHFVQRCIVDPGTGKIVDYIAWNARNRKFPIDMAGFGAHVRHFLSPDSPEDVPMFNVSSMSGQLESDFIDGFGIPLAEIEPLGDNCTKVNVWHVRTAVENFTRYSFDELFDV
ncbi:unnamed protein product [Vitrella brassicaformis CCMP3155]|uniref:Galactosylgalactosylxylosylprotein 3-beta-glucuronosyltransferase n=1 Tax=Vitrella brassicaformis (strain CCMP3155) TaxID=1169540 RepID=A0A0G4G2A8_VITBC|nr:unnamed protein product [Vitrella brassicaformis CCMP3155]|eukprot:CEM22120.1 unnamed protein product [Vitrella brassicaformis CCMP3155]